MFSLDFQAPETAVFIPWRGWQPTARRIRRSGESWPSVWPGRLLFCLLNAPAAVAAQVRGRVGSSALATARIGSASTILLTLGRAREAPRRFQIALSFFSFRVDGPRADGAGRPRLRSAVMGRRLVLALGFQAGAVVDFIHWRLAAERHGRAGDNFFT